MEARPRSMSNRNLRMRLPPGASSRPAGWIGLGFCVSALAGCMNPPTGPSPRAKEHAPPPEPALIVEDSRQASPEDAALSGRLSAYLESLESTDSRKSGSNAPDDSHRGQWTPTGDHSSQSSASRRQSSPAFPPDGERSADTNAAAAPGSSAPAAQVQVPLIPDGVRSPRGTAEVVAPVGGESSVSGAGSPATANANAVPGGSDGGTVGINAPLRPRPRIVSVIARSAAEPVATGRTATGARANEPTVRSPSDAGMAEFIERWRASSDDSSFSRQIEERLLHVVSGDLEQARLPLTRVTDAEARSAARLVEALIAVRDSREDRVAAIEAAAEALREEAGVRIPVLAACREVRGFGQYDPIADEELVSGVAAEIVVYVEATDFRSERQADGAYLTRFEMRTRVLSRSGDVVVDEHDPRIEDRCRNRRRDCFVPRLIRIPGTLPAGEYVLKVTLTDTLGGSVAEVGTSLKVRAPRR
ncbi:MAG: hypothetical protein HRU75_03875 [Planctomycetia bacterium]|nr:MAG: hypothetical protein HRU75_03875 [Planctomycetia bacterium]